MTQTTGVDMGPDVFAELREELGIEAPWEARGEGHWVEAAGLDPVTLAARLLARQARFVTLTATPTGDGGFRLLYHWDLDGSLLNIAIRVPGACVASIAAVCPAADWVEREVRDYYGLEFTDREDTPPLMLREGDERALFVRTRALGRDADPADTARRTGSGPAAQPPAAPTAWNGAATELPDAGAEERE